MSRNIFLITILFCTPIYMSSQAIEYDVINPDFNVLRVSNLWGNDGLKRYKATGGFATGPRNLTTCDGGKCRKDTHYEKIEYSFKRQVEGKKYLHEIIPVYSAGKVYEATEYKSQYKNGRRKSKKYKVLTVKRTGPLYHAKTGVVLSEFAESGNYQENYDNGNFRYKEVYIDGSVYATYQNPDGLLEAQGVKTPSISYKYECKYDGINECSNRTNPKSKGISLYSDVPSFVLNADNEVYRGTGIAGTYEADNEKTYTGYFLPLTDKLMGNGSVLLETDTNTGERKWVIIANGHKVFETREFNYDVNLDVAHLTSNTSVNVESYRKLINTNKNYNGGKDFGITKVFIPSAETKSLSTPNTTYGVRISSESTNTKIPMNKKTCEVGFFKNGVLDGLGYKSILIPYYTFEATSLSYKFKEYLVIVEYGIFSDGVLVEGISNRAYDRKGFDVWSPSPVKGLQWVKTSPISNIHKNDKSFLLTNLKKGDLLYVENDVNRMVKVVDVDYLYKRIKVCGRKNENEIAYLTDRNSVYKADKKTNISYDTKPCWKCYGAGKKSYKKYKTVYQNKSFDLTSTNYSNRYSGNGYLYSKTTTSTKTYKYQVPKKVSDGVGYSTCSVCKGSGKLSTSKNEIHYELSPLSW